VLVLYHCVNTEMKFYAQITPLRKRQIPIKHPAVAKLLHTEVNIAHHRSRIVGVSRRYEKETRNDQHEYRRNGNTEE
jgi:hypothetical protein